jgi:hypothetical protein
MARLPADFSPARVADFAAGDGALLAAARAAYPGADLYYNDYNRSAVRRIGREHPDWFCSASDFTGSHARARRFFAELVGRIDLILLNPPFSQRSRDLLQAELGGKRFRCSVAMAFVVHALRFLAPAGHLAAILPLGCFDRHIDCRAWEVIGEFFRIQKFEMLDEYTFSLARARSRIVVLSGSVGSERSSDSRIVAGTNWLQLKRGSYQMHFCDSAKTGERHPLVHTTNLQHGRIVDIDRWVSHRSSVSGPAVLFPRVGKVLKSKIAILRRGWRVVLSDCVFAVECQTHAEATQIRARVLSDWVEFANIYSGTGAPYTTSRKLSEFLCRSATCNPKRVVPTSVKALRKESRYG